jgi:heme o synthase
VAAVSRRRFANHPVEWGNIVHNRVLQPVSLLVEPAPLSMPREVVGFVEPASRGRWWVVASNYFGLVKPRIMVLLLITTLAAALIAASTRHVGHLEVLRLVLLTLVGGTFASGGASALNHFIDRDIDKLMARTKNRPLPSGRLQPVNALVFGLVLTALSVAVFGFWVNWLSAFLALAGNFYYVVIYTYWLKRLTPQNIVIGGVAGAIPPLVGWAAVRDDIALPGLILFLIITLWTPPHFWSLSILTQKDYTKAGIPMLPVVRGLDKTRWNIFAYTIILVASTLLLSATQAMGWFYLGMACALGGYFLVQTGLLLREASLARARACFIYSNLYLALLFSAMVVDRLLALR